MPFVPPHLQVVDGNHVARRAEAAPAAGRERRDYDAFIDQLTAGTVEVSVDRHHDGTVKYETWKDSMGEFGGNEAGKMVDAEFVSPATREWW